MDLPNYKLRPPTSPGFQVFGFTFIIHFCYKRDSVACCVFTQPNGNLSTSSTGGCFQEGRQWFSNWISYLISESYTFKAMLNCFKLPSIGILSNNIVHYSSSFIINVSKQSERKKALNR